MGSEVEISIHLLVREVLVRIADVSRYLGWISGSPWHSWRAGLCALLGNQQSHNMTLTNLQVVELQRAVAAQELATEKQAAALVQAKIDEKVAEEMKKVAPGYLPVQPGAVPPEGEKRWGRRLVVISIWLVSRCAEEGKACRAS